MGTKAKSDLVVSKRGTYGPVILELLQTKSGRIAWCAEGARLDATDAIHSLMNKQGIHQAELARLIGIGRASLNGILSGRQNLTLETMARVLYELGHEMRVQVRPLHPQVLKLQSASKAKSKRTAAKK